jgi:ferredoxin
VDLHPIHIGILTIPIVFLILVVWLSFTRGRLYCNTVCPVGTFLGLVSKISLFQIRLNPSTCTKCGLCERKCKGGCIETTTQRVEFSRCVGCFNCLEVCPFDSAEYSLNPLYQKAQVQENPNPTPHQTDGSKRKFLASLALVFFSVTKISKAQELVSHSATTPINRKNPVSPPGSQSIDRFNDSCTACNLCVNVCPTQVLQPSLLEYGLRGLMQPHLDFHAGYCNYECVLCSEVCPTGAILPLNVEEKKLTQMGQTHFVKENCIVETEGTACGACAETCPTQAVAMVDYKNNLKIPEVTNDICIGCGACENSCPTLPYKAIYVEGNPLHQQAEEPDKKQVEKAKSEEEFPF